MMRLIFACFLSLLTFGCTTNISAPRYVEHIPYHVDGSEKPKIIFLPVVDSSESFVPWDIKAEFNNALRYQAISCGDLYAVPEKEVLAYLQTEGCIEAFDEDLSFANRFCGNDYVVALELIEHALIPFERGKIYPPIPPQTYSWRSVLQMKMRLRILDLRSGTPRILLQEIFTSNYAIPLSAECMDYNANCWGSKAFPSTPWGLAHKRLVCDLMFRIETAIQGM
ncbi:MAG: hypothetical protein H0T62_07695 [Parachlamydiaceae bacterium]|nr:hypothetical protein [Parachlamydiaceae bacterium]